MKTLPRAIALTSLLALALVACAPTQPAAPPSATPAPPTATSTATARPSPTATATATPRPSPTATPAPVVYRAWVPKLSLYTAPDTTAYGGYILRGRTFTILGEEDGWGRVGGPNGEVPPDPYWLPLSDTAYAPVGAPPDLVTTGRVDVCAGPEGEVTGYIAPGVTLRVVEVQDAWLKVETCQAPHPDRFWMRMDAAFYPQGEPVPVPSPTPRPWPGQIGDLQTDGYVVYNLSARVGAVGAYWGWRDANGQLCPDGGANLPCEGKTGYNSGMEEQNIAYVKEMFARYGEGRTLAISIRDDAPADVPLTYDGPYYQQYGSLAGGAMELHLVFKGAFFALAPEQKEGFRWLVNLKLWAFLANYSVMDAAQFEASLLRNQSSGGGPLPLREPLARDLTGLAAPAKIILKF